MLDWQLLSIELNLTARMIDVFGIFIVTYMVGPRFSLTKVNGRGWKASSDGINSYMFVISAKLQV